ARIPELEEHEVPTGALDPGDRPHGEAARAEPADRRPDEPHSGDRPGPAKDADGQELVELHRAALTGVDEAGHRRRDPLDERIAQRRRLTEPEARDREPDPERREGREDGLPGQALGEQRAVGLDVATEDP